MLVIEMSTRARERFESLVDRSGGPDACHPWRGALDKDGYGRFGKRYRLASRIVCEAANGPPFPGAEAAHACDNPPCCNGAHLSWKTHAQNIADREARGRTSRGGSHYHAVLNEASVARIKARLAAGEKGVRIAADYGVGARLISYIKTGANWKHVAAVRP